MLSRLLVQSARTRMPALGLVPARTLILPASRLPAQLQRSPVAQGMAVSQTRGYAEEAAGKDGENRAKLTFRGRLKEVPVELYPLGVVVIACVVGASVALTRLLMHDPDMLHHRSVGSGALQKNTPIPGTDKHGK